MGEVLKFPHKQSPENNSNLSLEKAALVINSIIADGAVNFADPSIYDECREIAQTLQSTAFADGSDMLKTFLLQLDNAVALRINAPVISFYDQKPLLGLKNLTQDLLEMMEKPNKNIGHNLLARTHVKWSSKGVNSSSE